MSRCCSRKPWGGSPAAPGGTPTRRWATPGTPRRCSTRSRGETAAERLRNAEERTLADVLRAHGDLRDASFLARALVAAARRGALETTRDLVAVLDRALGGRSHPRRYAQVFQALRIWVNEEAAELEAVLEWLPEAMIPGGVVVTIAYHS